MDKAAYESGDRNVLDTKILEKIDDEEAVAVRSRDLRGWSKTVVNLLFGLMTVVQIYFIMIGMITPMIHTAVFVWFVVVMCILNYKPYIAFNKQYIPWYDWLVALVASAPFAYVTINYSQIIVRASRPNRVDMAMAVIAVMAVIEISRRAIGLTLPIIGVLFLAYAIWGYSLPGILAHRGYNITRVTTTLIMTSNGIFASPVRTAATMVYMFVMFGAYLGATGAGRVITDLSLAYAGKFTGGAAKVAVISSAAMGSVSGSSTANVITTGQITIPLMVKSGYRRYFAAAVEAAASTGGTLTPPIMGAGAFIMVELTGTSYTQVIAAAAIPAFLYYVAVMASVHFEAKKQGLVGMSKDQLPNFWRELREGGNVLVPLVLLLALILVNYPVIYVAFYSTIALILTSFLNKKTRLNFNKFIDAFISSSRSILQPAAACACAGLVIGMLGLTGLGVRFSSMAMQVGVIHTFLALFVTMIICILLGMGLPVVASYIIGAAIAAPALINMGFPVLASHMFVFFFSCVAPITPPVAVTAYIAAGMAGAAPLKTAFTACFLGLPVFIVPYLFVYNPGFMLQGDMENIVYQLIICTIAFTVFAAGYVGFFGARLTILERAAMVVGAACLVHLDGATDMVGFALVGAALVYHYWRKRKFASIAVADSIDLKRAKP